MAIPCQKKEDHESAASPGLLAGEHDNFTSALFRRVANAAVIEGRHPVEQVEQTQAGLQRAGDLLAGHSRPRRLGRSSFGMLMSHGGLPGRTC